MECDVLVIGAGPAGLWAAQKAAEAELDVIILEEHMAIGLQKHCSGWILGCEFTHQFLHEIKKVLPCQPVLRMVIRDPVSGNIIEDIEDSGWGGYLVRRELFDRELARCAILSGARLFLHTRATSLIEKGGRVVGVHISSPSLSDIKAKAIICADGMQSATSRGFAKKSIGSSDNEGTYPGVQMELAGVEDVMPGQIEIYEGNDQSLHGRSLWPHAQGVTLASFSTVGAYRKLVSRKDNVFSRKIAPSFPLYISSFQNRKNMGMYYHSFTRDGVMYIGEACGGSGIVHGMISGHYAAQVAIACVRDGMAYPCATEKYESMMGQSDIVKVPFCYRHIRSFFGSYRSWLEQSSHIRV